MEDRQSLLLRDLTRAPGLEDLRPVQHVLSAAAPDLTVSSTELLSGAPMSTIRTIGIGGSGTVTLAEDPATGEQFAVKTVHPDRSPSNPDEAENDDLVYLVGAPPSSEQATTDPTKLTFALKEAHLLTNMNHPHIPKVFAFTSHADGSVSLTMEFVAGKDLAAHIADIHRDPAVPPPLTTVCELVSAVGAAGRAAEYAHSLGVIHRDIKPENILLGAPTHGFGSSVKLIDFELALITEQYWRRAESIGEKASGMDARVGRTLFRDPPGKIMGTLHYMSPEQVDRPAAVDHRSDIFSLGVTLYQVLTGRRPFGDGTSYMPAVVSAIVLGTPTPPHNIIPSVDPVFEKVCLRALKRDPDERFQSIGEMVDLLDARVRQLNRESEAHTPPELVSLWDRMRRYIPGS